MFSRNIAYWLYSIDKFVTQPVKGRIRILLGLQNTVLGEACRVSIRI